MKTKKLSLLLAFVLVLTMLTACGSGDNPSEKATDAPNAAATDAAENTPEPAKFSRGSFSSDGKTYTSDFLGISFTLPEGWFFLSDEEIAEVMNLGAEIAFEDGAENANKQIEQTTTYDMMASSELGDTNVSLMFENLSLQIGGKSMTEMDYIDILTEQLSALEVIGYELAEPTEKYLVGDTYSVLGASIPDYSTYQEYYIRRVGNYMLAIIFTGTADPASSGVDVCFSKK